MHDFDITLMVLSQPSSLASIKLLQLSDHFSEIGLNCKVSTHPSELSRIRPFTRRHAIILDGTDNSEYDVYTLASSLRSLHLSFVVLLVNNDPHPADADQALGVDLCLPIRTSREDLTELIITALHGEGHPQTLASVETQRHEHSQPLFPKPETPLILSRDGAGATEAPPLASYQERGAWALEERGWRLVAPTGRAVTLTSAERKLMRRFFKSPSAAVWHHEFDNQHGSPGRPHSGSLTVIVSRLRRKCREAGISLPIQSNRGEGYEFTGRCNAAYQIFDNWH